jgi:hypothetical protein
MHVIYKSFAPYLVQSFYIIEIVYAAFLSCLLFSSHPFPSTNRDIIIADTVLPVAFNKVAGASIIVLITASTGRRVGLNP